MSWHNKINDLDLPKEFFDSCEVYTELLLKYNQTHNVSGAKSKNKVYENIVDSVYPLRYIEKVPKNAIDIGSGAGFPGIILALAMRDTEFTLYEPIAKKSAFLHLVKSALGLKNVNISTKRVECATPFTCSLICSRAVTDTKMLIELCKDYINEYTTLLFYKGSNTPEEVKELENYKIYERGHRRYLFLKDIK